MSYSVKTIAVFEQQAKRLAKKHLSLKQDLRDMIEQLKDEPIQGAALGNSCYKIRMKITSKGRGKSGGARLITTVVVQENIVYLLTIYDKSEKETITDTELANLLAQLPE